MTISLLYTFEQSLNCPGINAELDVERHNKIIPKYEKYSTRLILKPEI